MDRRRFLRGAAAAAAGAMGRRAMAARRIERIGLQLYTVRRELERDFEETLRAVAAIGFDEVETAGLHGRPAGEVRRLFDELGLAAPSSHTDTAGIAAASLEATIDTALALGNRYLVCAYLREDERRSADDYRRWAEIFNRVGERCRRAGLRFGYHNHDFELAPLEGVVPLRLLLEETEPELVVFEMDLYWITKGGGDPLAYFEDFPGRFRLWHVKDMDRTAERGFAPVGRGRIDFPRIFAAADRAGAEHFFVEQDETEGSALEAARIGYEYLRSLER